MLYFTDSTQVETKTPASGSRGNVYPRLRMRWRKLPKDDPTLENIKRTCEEALNLYRILGFNSEGYSLLPTINHFLKLCEGRNWMKVVKAKKDIFFSSHLDLDQPSFDFPCLTNPKVFLRGRAARFVGRLKIRNKFKYFTLLTSISIGLKGSLPRPSDKDVEDSVAEFIKLVFEQKQNPPDQYWINQINRTVDEVIGDRKCSLADCLFNPTIPSSSSNYINNRSFGGGIGAIGNDPFFKDGLPKLSVRAVKGKFFSNAVVTGGKEPCLMKGRERPSGIVFDGTSIREDFSKFLYHAYEQACEEQNECIPVGLKEALKIRIITKSAPYRSFFLNQFQKPLRKILSSHPVFRLTGEWVTPDVIQSLGVPNSDEGWLSGDYEKSTDKLQGWASEAACNRLCDTYYSEVCKAFPNFRNLYLESLTGFKVEWEGKTLQQTNGQLMGSCTSFSILCLINASICRKAMEHGYWTKAVPLNKARLLVNGDDCLFITNQRGHVAWTVAANEHTLKPSQGKYFYVPKNHPIPFCQINSRNFILVNGIYHAVPVCLLGIAACQVRSTSGDTGNVDPQTLAMRVKDFLKEIHTTLYDDREQVELATKHMMNRVSKIIKNSPKEIQDIPWRLPQHLGGLGLPGKPSSADLRKVTYLQRNGLIWPIHKDPVQFYFYQTVSFYLKKFGLRPYVNVGNDDFESSGQGSMYWFVYRKHGLYLLPEVGKVTQHEYFARPGPRHEPLPFKERIHPWTNWGVLNRQYHKWGKLPEADIETSGCGDYLTYEVDDLNFVKWDDQFPLMESSGDGTSYEFYDQVERNCTLDTFW